MAAGIEATIHNTTIATNTAPPDDCGLFVAVFCEFASAAMRAEMTRYTRPTMAPSTRIATNRFHHGASGKCRTGSRKGRPWPGGGPYPGATGYPDGGPYPGGGP